MIETDPTWHVLATVLTIAFVAADVVTSGFKSETPVHIVEAADSSNISKTVTLNIDEEEGVITMNIDRLKGLGTRSNWIILGFFAIATVLGPPVAVADGGTGETAKVGIRTAFEVARTFTVDSMEASLPGSPNNGDKHLMSGGANENDIAIYLSGWTFETPGVGDYVHILDTHSLGIYTGISGLSTGEFWLGSKWKGLITPPDLTRYWYSADADWTSAEVEDFGAGRFYSFIGLSDDVDATLPNPGWTGMIGRQVWIMNRDSVYDVNLVPSGGAGINGSASLTLPPGGATLLLANTGNWVALTTP